MCSASITHAIPPLVNYQGILLDNTGTPITVSTQVEFRIWDASGGGAELWMELQVVTPNAGGLFTVLLGSVNPIPDSAWASATAYLGTTVTPDSKLTPRRQLVSVAYAFRPGAVDEASGGNITSKVSIGPGHNNLASGSHTTIAGGQNNTAEGNRATVGGGQWYYARGDYSVVAAGGGPIAADSNSAMGSHSVIGGGDHNVALGAYSIVPGGQSTMAAGDYAWAAVSDRNIKENVRPVSGSDVLAKISQLEINRWNYQTQDPSIEHIGPMAQDFYRLFGVGDNNTTITTIDPDGIALAAIKELDERNRRLEERMEELTRLVESLTETQ
jgi:hypothetical protein